MVLGPFKGYRPAGDHIEFQSGSPLHPWGSIKLDPDSIYLVLKSNNYLYVIYEYDQYLKPFSSSLPERFEEVDLTYEVISSVECKFDRCPEICVEDPEIHPNCDHYVRYAISKKVIWRNGTNIDVVNDAEEWTPEPEDYIVMSAVTERNAPYILLSILGNRGYLDPPAMVPEISEVLHEVSADDFLEPFAGVMLYRSTGSIVNSPDEEEEEVGKHIVLVTISLYKTGIMESYWSAFDRLRDAWVFYTELLKLLSKGGYYRGEIPEPPEVEAPEPKVKRRETPVERLLSAMPDWADGILVYTRAGGLVAVPVKKSRYGNEYYFKTNWRKLDIDLSDVPSDIIVTRTGVYRVGRISFGTKYVIVTPE